MTITNSPLLITLLCLAMNSYSEVALTNDQRSRSECTKINSNNQKLPDSCLRGSLSVGAFYQEHRVHAGLEASIMFDHVENQASKISLGLSIQDKKGILDFFRNISYTHYYHFNLENFNPYLGVGVVLGSTDKCTDEEEENDECEETGSASIYPEIGLQIRTNNFTILPFVRRYDFNDHNTFGLSIGRNF